MPSNEPRDQLTADLMAYAWSDHGLRSAHNEHRFEATCAICTANVDAVAGAVTALGWRPPPRVIETDEELHNVPAGIIVQAADGTIAARHRLGVGVVFGDERPFPWSTLRAPATVLWEPEEAR